MKPIVELHPSWIGQKKNKKNLIYQQPSDVTQSGMEHVFFDDRELKEP